MLCLLHSRAVEMGWDVAHHPVISGDVAIAPTDEAIEVLRLGACFCLYSCKVGDRPRPPWLIPDLHQSVSIDFDPRDWTF